MQIVYTYIDLLYLQADDELQFYEGCGETKSCFGASVGCIPTKTCTAAVSSFVQGEQYFFELMARDSKYVAVGLSKDSKMVCFYSLINIYI